MSENQLNMISKTNFQSQKRFKLIKILLIKLFFNQQQSFKSHLPKNTIIQFNSTSHRFHDVVEDSFRDSFKKFIIFHNNRCRKQMQKAFNYKNDESSSLSRIKFFFINDYTYLFLNMIFIE